MYNDGVHLGQFEITSGRMIVTDPCYDKGTWCAGILDAVNGTWDAYLGVTDAGTWGMRVTEIEVHHSKESHHSIPWENVEFEVGVDSGQAGFFDESLYPESLGDTNFYDNVCDLTLGKERGGILPFGAVSRSGYGDGGYDCLVKRKNGNVVAAKIVFIANEEEEEDADY